MSSAFSGASRGIAPQTGSLVLRLQRFVLFGRHARESGHPGMTARIPALRFAPAGMTTFECEPNVKITTLARDARSAGRGDAAGLFFHRRRSYILLNPLKLDREHLGPRPRCNRHLSAGRIPTPFPLGGFFILITTPITALRTRWRRPS